MSYKNVINKVLDYYDINKNEAIFYKKELEFLSSISDNDEFLPNTYPYPFILKYLNHNDVVIHKDIDGYSYFNTPKGDIYLPLNWESFTTKYSSNFIQAEQDIESPHRYWDIGCINSSVLDIGSSEGIFTLNNYNTTNDYHLFDIGFWTDSTIRTFKGKSNIKFHNKLVSSNDYPIDSIEFNKPVGEIKIDVEGAEIDVLNSAKNILDKFNPVLQIATYHRNNDYRDICRYLKSIGYNNIQTSKGYLIYHNDFNEPPYFREVLIRAAKF